MQAKLDKVLEQDPTTAMDEALRLARRPGREQHIRGVIEWQAFVVGEHIA